jgi:L-fuconolactonase
MKLDAHQHFWNYTANAADYGWMNDACAVLRRDFEPPQLEPLLREIGFDGTIAVQARERREETDYLLALAERHPLVKGVVGWLDLTDPGVEREIERYAAQIRLRGLRMVIHDREDVNFADSPAHRRGVGMLRRHGLTYDLLLRPQHLPSAIRLVDAWPDQPFVVDHLAKPLIATGAMSPWRESFREIARRPNVCCKLSGMVTEASWTTWQPADLRPYLDVALEAFGPERLMIGSDWPVCTCAADYVRTMRATIAWADTLAPAERDAILGGTCARFYGVPRT